MLSEAKKTEVDRLLSRALALYSHTRLTAQLAERDLERQAHEIEALTVKPTRHTFATPKQAPAKTCGKRWYYSEASARNASASLAHTVRTYKCPDCSKSGVDIFHFTKRDYA